MLLIACTVVSVALANSPFAPDWLAFWKLEVAGLTLEHWVNDALMAVFFLLVGLELEREIYVGELSDLRKALLPIVAAVGGMVVPAAIHYALNADTPAQPGAGIPMATDIAFALAALSLLGSRVPTSLKVFLTAFAVIDDLGAVIVIGAAYTANLSMPFLLGAVAVFAGLVVLNRAGVMSVVPYLLGGALMWFFMLKSGVHATVAGVALAFAIPFRSPVGGISPSLRMEKLLHKPVALWILPIFALANTAIVVGAGWQEHLLSANSLGIGLGLIVGKPLGVTLLCMAAVALGLCRLPDDLRWADIVGAGLLGGIGFTMSIFITNLAFESDPGMVNASKVAIVLASVIAAVLGTGWLAGKASSSKNA